MRKIFIVAPYFPPSAMPPAQRVRLIVQHSSSLGYFPIIFTVNSKYRDEIEDPWMLDLIGRNYKVVLVDCLDQKKTRSLKVGDLGLRMLPFLFQQLNQNAKKEKPDFILYSVPPWYILTGAPLLKKKTGIPYGIDFIDPWVHDIDLNERTIKKRISYWISKKMEKFVCKHASIIYSVSEGINSNLIERYPELSNKVFIAVPYGAEQNDYDSIRHIIPTKKHDKIIIRYIGAIWHDCFKVLDGLMPALAAISREFPVEVEFLGTSYAREEMSKTKMDKWIFDNNMQEFTTENSLRLSYRKAVELTLQSDILLLIGGMAPYYAASKLMGLLVSKKPFVAFVHEDSFPSKLLQTINYPYLVTYNNTEKRMPKKRMLILTEVIRKAILEKETFTGVDLSHPIIKKNTAFGMTKTFLDPINKISAYND